MQKVQPPKILPFRLTIGVTGHRSLENTEALRATVQRVIDDLLARCQGAALIPVKLCALSPLAEGADRLVAQELLRRDPECLLKAVLPMTLEDYLDDFTDSASRREFHNLLAASRFSVALRQRPLRQDYPREKLTEARIQAYEDVGKFIVDHCDVLIALWDDEPARGKGGTAAIKKYAEQQGCPLYIIYTVNPLIFKFKQGRRCNLCLVPSTEFSNRAI